MTEVSKEISSSLRESASDRLCNMLGISKSDADSLLDSTLEVFGLSCNRNQTTGKRKALSTNIANAKLIDEDEEEVGYPCASEGTSLLESLLEVAVSTHFDRFSSSCHSDYCQLDNNVEKVNKLSSNIVSSNRCSDLTQKTIGAYFQTKSSSIFNKTSKCNVNSVNQEVETPLQRVQEEEAMNKRNVKRKLTPNDVRKPSSDTNLHIKSYPGDIVDLVAHEDTDSDDGNKHSGLKFQLEGYHQNYQFQEQLLVDDVISKPEEEQPITPQERGLEAESLPDPSILSISQSKLSFSVPDISRATKNMKTDLLEHIAIVGKAECDTKQLALKDKDKQRHKDGKNMAQSIDKGILNSDNTQKLRSLSSPSEDDSISALEKNSNIQQLKMIPFDWHKMNLDFLSIDFNCIELSNHYIKESDASVHTTSTSSTENCNTPSFPHNKGMIQNKTDLHFISDKREYSSSSIISPPFIHLAKALSAVCSTTKRLEKERILTNLLLTFLYFDRDCSNNNVECRNKQGEYGELKGDGVASTTSSISFQDKYKNSTNDNIVEKEVRKKSTSIGEKDQFHCRTSIMADPSKIRRSAVLHATLICGNVATTDDGSVLYIGHAAISNAICQALVCSEKTLKENVKKSGELGDASYSIMVGEKCDNKTNGSSGIRVQSRLGFVRETIKSKSLKILAIMDTIWKLNSIGGNCEKGIESKRKKILCKLFSDTRNPDELRFAVKIFCNNLRTGATLITVMQCLATAHVLHTHGITNALWDRDEVCSASSYKNLKTIKKEIADMQEMLRSVYARHHNLKSCVLALVYGGVNGLDQCTAEIGIPLQPLLAAPCRNVDEVSQHYYRHYVARNEKTATKINQNGGEDKDNLSHAEPFFTAEYKYDGIRCQIHVNITNKKYAIDHFEMVQVKIFSRHLDEITHKYPPVVKWMKNQKWSKSLQNFILDAEIVAVKRSKNVETVILPFQVLSTMTQSCTSDNIGLCVYAFDVLYINEISLIHQTLQERKKKMRQCFGTITEDGAFEFARGIDIPLCGDTAEKAISSASAFIQPFFDESIGKGRCEGLMFKSLYSLYSSFETRERSGGWGGWRKLKKDYVDSIADSFDVVPIGAWRGNGRKTKWFSPFLLAVYNRDTGEFESLCRCMSGFSDQFYEEKTAYYLPRIIHEKHKPQNVSTAEEPSVWFHPSEVWEIRGADLTLSPVHHAARRLSDLIDVNEGRGISLRFPRFLRVRSDKTIFEATSSQEIIQFFSSQSQRR